MNKLTCQSCEKFREEQDGKYLCEMTGESIFKIEGIPSWCTLKNQNCHSYCWYAKYCHDKGENGWDPDNCGMYYHIEDILAEAREIESEMKAHDERFVDGEWIE